MGLQRHSESQPCRFCGLDCYASDPEGPLHPCCAYWIGKIGYEQCVACVHWRARLNVSGTRPKRKPAPKTDSTLAVLERLRAAGGLWVDARAFPDADLSDLVSSGQVESRPSPISEGQQYRMAS